VIIYQAPLGPISLESQGYHITDNTFAQDNKSAIQLERNNSKSTGQKSCDIDIHFFFTKDRIKHDDIVVEYCPTEQMLADSFTKPLQGALFTCFKNILMRFAHVTSLYTDHIVSSTFAERVENNANNNKSNMTDPLDPVQPNKKIRLTGALAKTGSEHETT
jgi:hypothetical protein